MSHWSHDAVFYHLFPLGAAGAPARNELGAPPAARLEGLGAWLDLAAGLGATALQLGPVFESSAHGYDVADYGRVDRRLGTAEGLAAFTAAAHRRGLRVAFDAVFHHVGRDFWAFRDVRARPSTSPYRSWFFLDDRRRSPYGDPFAYEGWSGHYDLVKLNVAEPAVREHLFAAARDWIHRFDVDGLRLDAADVLDLGFQRELAAVCRALKPDFWLVGEVVHGDYGRWAGPGALDAVTNYELYKALYSSHNDRNYFELAHALDRQFGPAGRYRGLPLYAFADNHDVARVASRLAEPAHLYPLYAALFAAPGAPSSYYGSEWGVEGRKAAGGDAPLRPALDPAALPASAPRPDLARAVRRFVRLRRELPALRRGGYRTLFVAPEQLAFARESEGQAVVVALNASGRAARVRVPLPGLAGGRLVDVLNEGEAFEARGGAVELDLHPCWARVLRLEPAGAAGAAA
ncbi:MAG TPA: alpha-amylase family glycosyl hydrolase [Polyangiaceae bacterium]|nr:alpha-amylase family glycosyl hydrolase [Polyangiaceae bacterium]